MSRKKHRQSKSSTATVQASPQTTIKAHKPPSRQRPVPTPRWMIPFVLVVTFLMYLPALKAGFVNWDDMDYVYDNLLIRDLSNLNTLLSTPVQGNYHPLTMLSLAINYAMSGLDAWSYHLFNLLFHLVNSYLVFRLAFLLGNRNPVIAFATSLLFAIHPMHVESVAWVSERKDVLYALFFIAGLIAYTKYVDTGSKKQYWLAFIFLVLSLLSKPAAVIFPLVLFSIDLLRRRKFNMSVFLEKLPYFIPAVIMGVLTYVAQKEKGATGGLVFPFLTKILMGFYGFMMYLVKMILPFRLVPFYPYPAINEPLPAEYYAGPLVFTGLALLVWFSWRRTTVFAFGIVFYFLNLLLVLQFLPVGSAVIAERYTYIPYIGLFFIIGWLLSNYAGNNKIRAYSILFALTVFLGILTYRQAAVWKDGASLWDHAIKTQPNSNAYGLRASLLRAEGNFSKALEYYNEAVKLNAASYEVFANRGNVYFDLKKPDSAYADYRRALAIKPDHYPALDNLGALFATREQYDSALVSLNKALTIEPNYKPAYSNRALVNMNMKRYKEAIADFSRFLQFEPGAADPMNSIGYCYRMLGKPQEALPWINKALEIQVRPYYYLNRSYAYFELNNLPLAKADAIRAKQAGSEVNPVYQQQLGLQ